MTTGASVPLLYAGVGSRKTPLHVQDQMRRISDALQQRGWRLRSGGAEGADTAFWEGAVRGHWGDEESAPATIAEVYLADRGQEKEEYRTDATGEAESLALAAPHHPMWARLPSYTKRLLARNTRILLGRLPKSAPVPVRFVVCWTRDGAERATTVNTGGTGHTIRVAVAQGIPVLNMVSGDFRQRLWDLVRAEEDRVRRPLPAAP